MRADRNDEDYTPDLPPLVGHEFLLEHLWAVGPVMAGAHGPQPLSHVEIAAWMKNTYTSLDAWECNTLRRLSVEYAAEFSAAATPSRPAPYATKVIDIDARKLVAAKIAQAFSAMMGSSQPKAVLQ